MLRYVWLVALREYAENAKTKGFWIGILIFPLMLYAGFKVPRFLEKESPTRYFVVEDKSGAFLSAIDDSLARSYAKATGRAQQEWSADAIRAGEKDAGVGRLEDWIREKLSPEMAQKFREGVKDQVQDVIRNGAPAAEQMNGLALFKSMTPMERTQILGALMEWQAKAIEAGRKKVGEFKEPRKKLVRVQAPAGVSGDSVEPLRPYLNGEKKIEVDGKPADLFAAILIPADAKSATVGQAYDKIQYWSTNLTDDDVKEVVRGGVESTLRGKAFEAGGITQERVEQIQRTSIKYAERDPRRAAGKEEVGFDDTVRQWAPVGAVYLLFVAIFSVAQMLLNNTTEEKTNRVIEVLLSSVTPTELMFGKLLGIAAVGLTMVGAWIVSFVVMLDFIQRNATGFEATLVSAVMEALYAPELLIAFTGYFLLGYLLYAGVFLAIGSIVNSLKEAQNLMGPLMVIMMVPIFTMVFIARDPNGTLARILSWIPLYTPFVMMNRAAASPPAFDVYGTLALLLLSVIVTIWLSGKIFRVGILRTGQPPKFLELLRMMELVPRRS